MTEGDWRKLFKCIHSICIVYINGYRRAPFVSLPTDTSLPREAYIAQLGNVAKALMKIFFFTNTKKCGTIINAK